MCICRYTRKLCNIKPIYKIDVPRAATKEYRYAYYPINTPLPQHSKQFEFNDSLTIQQNVETATYELKVGEVAYLIIPINKVPITEIYSSKLQRKYQRSTDSLMCVVKVKE